LPVRSSSDGPSGDGFDLAVVALSARALAHSAKRAGLRALAIDLFADADTREHAARAVKAQAAREGLAFARAGLLEIIKRNAPEGLPIVLGAGFEHAPGLMRAIARRNPILGAAPDVVARLKDPAAFADLLDRLDVRRPDIVLDRSAGEEGGWLSKRAGASGGAHIREGSDRGGRRRYLQRRVDGRSVSALFLSDGRSASIIGFSEQWVDPAPGAPYRYGGAVGPVPVASHLKTGVADALDRIVAETGLVGLASADMILPEDGSGFVLLEINPRPGATLDLFDRAPWPSLLGLHLDACEGRLPGHLPSSTLTVHGAVIVHAPCRVRPAAIARPVWTADWPSCDDSVPAGAPICTVVASGASPAGVRALLAERRSALLSLLRAAAPAPTNHKAPA
jgi:predicted ATP-grasp superfamily ATP-dependent carboligase